MTGARVLETALRRVVRPRIGGSGSVQRTLVGSSQNERPSHSARPVGLNPSTSEHHRTIHTTPLNLSPSSSPSKPTTTTTTWRREPHQPPTTTHDPIADLPAQLCGVMRRLAHSVVVATATDRAGRPRGMTMSSFVSLSMEPVPLVTFNVRTPSRTLDAIHESGGVFNVHVLAEGGEGARVADLFTRGNAGAGEGLFEGLPEGVEVVEEDGEAPLLEGKGVLYVIKCRALGEGMVRVRDHVVVVGEVEGVVRGGGEGFGLVYADRRYRTLGECLVKGEK
ncbi:flavin reductase like domain-containing protein [Colletotrichum acutatum]|uniref:Flavin reductase like domain-containing protein n=1 Tax=Glomerella acutata TaxID=27357 RepID=A0AAD8UER8_GLOAC|nr:flavin reductase like domain-containing protein [Colletotrichum acutatum]KAK1715560.1 flavin reductase like domain-containing protein [Colletotrichum acutatum]